MDFTKMIALDRATFNDLALWLAQYIKAAFEKYPQARAAVMPHWGQVPASQLAQSTWIVLIRDTPYAGWEYFDPPVQVDVSGHFASLPARIGLRVEVYEKGLVVAGVCKDNQALGFFAELMKAMEDAWPRVGDTLDVVGSTTSEHREESHLEAPGSTDKIEPIPTRAERDEDEKSRGLPGSPGLDRADLIYRLTAALEAEEMRTRDPSMRWKEIARNIHWRYGIQPGGIKLLEDARKRLAGLQKSDPEHLLDAVAEVRKKKTEIR